MFKNNDFLPREDVELLQFRRLKDTLERVYHLVPFYRRKFDEAGITPSSIKSIDDLAEFLKVDPYYTVKCVAKKLIYEDESEVVLFFMRGCDNLQEVKALNATDALDIEDVSEDELIPLGLVPGFIGILDQDKAKHVIDNDLKNATNMICGANEKDYHFVGVDLGIISEVAYFADIAEVNEGDICPYCNGSLSFTKGIEFFDKT